MARYLSPSFIELSLSVTETARSDTAIMDAVYEFWWERSVRDLPLETMAARAKVGKPTLSGMVPAKPYSPRHCSTSA